MLLTNEEGVYFLSMIHIEKGLNKNSLVIKMFGVKSFENAVLPAGKTFVVLLKDLAYLTV